MTTDLPPVPPAVVKFAEDNGYKVTSKNDFWGEQVPFHEYTEIYNAEKEDIKIVPFYILVKDGKMRFATIEETHELIQVYR